jgi:hypothetical protein
VYEFGLVLEPQDEVVGFGCCRACLENELGIEFQSLQPTGDVGPLPRLDFSTVQLTISAENSSRTSMPKKRTIKPSRAMMEAVNAEIDGDRKEVARLTKIHSLSKKEIMERLTSRGGEPYKIRKRSEPRKEERFLFPFGKNRPKSTSTTGEEPMPKKRTINKSQIVRDALAKNPEASPKEIAAKLKAQGITAQYVSVVKSNSKAKKAGKKSGAKKTVAKKKPGRKPGRKAASTTSSLDATIEFIEASGGIDAAKAAIAQIERIKSL